MRKLFEIHLKEEKAMRIMLFLLGLAASLFLVCCHSMASSETSKTVATAGVIKAPVEASPSPIAAPMPKEAPALAPWEYKACDGYWFWGALSPHGDLVIWKTKDNLSPLAVLVADTEMEFSPCKGGLKKCWQARGTHFETGDIFTIFFKGGRMIVFEGFKNGDPATGTKVCAIMESVKEKPKEP